MHIEIGDHPAIHELARDERAGKRHALLPTQLARDRELDLARKLRILALLGRLDLVPRGFAIAQALGRTVGQHDLGVDDTGLVGEIVMASEPLVLKARG
jgi:hypothetical protein